MVKIIIIGAGIGGLSCYHALRKHLPSDEVEIKVYESHGSPDSTTSNIGGGLGLAPNGLRAIHSVSPRAAEYIQEHGCPGSLMTMRNSTGRKLGTLWSGRPERHGFGLLMLRRAVVHQGLLLDMPSDAVVWDTKLKTVEEVQGGVRLDFENGTSEVADLVIGADGVRSTVLKAIFGDQYQAEYDGLTGVGGFIPQTSLSKDLLESLKSETCTMTFGEHGFFGYSTCSSSEGHNDIIQWWSIYESPTPPSRNQAHDVIRDQLLGRHASWKSPHDSAEAKVYDSLVRLGCDDDNDTLLVLPRYVTPRIPHWTSDSGRILLLGDAAHAMPPDSGQGVSCAAEDSVAIGLLLKHFLVDQKCQLDDALKQTAKAYEGVRMKRVWKILDIAKRSGDQKKKLSTFQQVVRDLFFWVFCRLPESISDSMFAYDAEVAVGEYLSNLKK